MQQPTDTAAGAPITPAVTVQLQDSFGNNVSTPGIAVTLEADPVDGRIAGFVAPPTQNTGPSGLATFTGLAVVQSGRYALLASATSFSSATSVAFTIRPGVPSKIQATGGSPQSALIQTVFAQPLKTRVLDSFGNPVSGAAVTFTVPSSGASASLSSTSAVTDASGEAAVTATANSVAGSYSVTVAAAGVAASASFSLTNLTGAVGHVAFARQPSNTPAGAVISPAVTVRVTDAGSNPIAGASVTVDVFGASAGLDGTLSATTDAGGVATFADLSITAAGLYRLEALSSGISALSDPIQISPATSPALILAFEGDGQSAAVETSYSGLLKARVEDLYHNPIANVTVTFAAPASGASVTFSGPTTVNSGADGVAIAPAITANSQIGAFQVTATTASASGPALFNLVNVPGSASKLVFVQQPVDTVAGVPITPAVTVQLQDSGGNAVHTPGIAVRLDANALIRRLKKLTGATESSDPSGLVTFTNLSISEIGAYELEAVSLGLISATSNPFKITPGAPAKIETTGGTPQSATILTSFAQQLQVRVVDALDNPVTGATVTFGASGSGASATLSATSAPTDANGHAAVTATANSIAGSYSVVASVTGVGAIVSFLLTNVTGAPGQISFVQQPANTSAGAVINPPVTVRVADSGGNPVSSAAVTISLQEATAPLGGTLSGTTDSTGLATFADLSITAAGTYHLDAANGSISSASNSFQITPATSAFAIVAFEGDGQSAAVTTNYAGPLKARVEDLYHNPIANASVIFAAPAGGASVTFSGSTTVNSGADGIAIAPAMTANTQTGTFQVTATTAAASSPALFNLTNVPGSANKLAFIQQPSNAVAGTTITPPVTVQVQDSLGNAVHTAGISVTLQPDATVRRLKQLSGSATQSTDSSGLATFVNLSISQAGAYTLQANSSGLSSATSSSFTITAGMVTNIQATGGTPQSATIQTSFTQQLEATVLDSLNNPISGATVTFTAPASGASATLSASSAVTDANGHATVTASANSAAGSYSITATTTGVAATAGFSLTNLTGPVGHIAFVQQPSNTPAGVAITPAVTVRVTDAGSNPVAGVSVTVSVSGGTPSLTGTVTAATDASGVATFANLSISVAGSYRLEAASSGMTALSSSFQISAATSAVVILAFEGDGQSAAVGTAYAGPLKARVEDLFQNPVVNASVTFVAPVSGASVTFLGSTTVASGADGVAIAPPMSANTQTGAFQVTANTAAAAGPTLFNLTNVAGSANKLAFVQQPVSAVAGAILTPPMTVQIQDSSGNAVHTAGISITLQANATVRGQKQLSGNATQSTDSSGLATFANLSISQAGAYTLQADSAGLSSATSNSFSITAGAAAKIQTTAGTPQSATILTAFPLQLQVRVLDALDNPVSGVTVTFAAPGSGASATLSAPTAVTDASGQGAVTATANNAAGSYSVTAATAGVAASAGFSLTNLTGSVSHVAFVQQPSNTSAGAAISPAITVLVTDAGSNPVAGASVTVALSGSAAALAGTLSATTDAGGVATFADLSINVAGSYRLDAVSSGVTALSDPFQISAATSSVVILAFEGNSQSAAVSTAYSGPLKARVEDLYQNPIANASVTFTAPASGASVTFSGPATVNSGPDGVATAPALTANSQVGTFEVAATTAIASGPALFTLTNLPGSANKLAFVQQPVNSVAGATITPPLTVQLQDTFGNAVRTAGISITLEANALVRRLKELSGSSTQSTDPTGLATFANLGISQAGNYEFEATSAGLISATSNSFTITAGTAAKVQTTGGTPQSATIQTPYAQPLQVTVLDAFDNPVGGATVTFSAPGSGASATLSVQSAVTDPSGHAAVTATANSTAGSYSVTAAVAGAATSASFSLTNVTGAPGQISFVQQPSNAPAGAAINPPVTVRVVDSGGNPVSGAAVTIAVQEATAELGGTLSSTTDSTGLAAFADLNITVAGTYHLDVATASISGSSDPFQITPAASAVAILAFEGDGQSAAVGTTYSGPLKARVEDLYHNPIANAPVTFTAPPAGASVTFSGSTTVNSGADGVALAPAITANSQAGAFQVTATTASASGPAVFNLTNVPGSANKLVFIQQPANTVAGATIAPALTVQVQDSSGNAVHTAGILITLQPDATVRRLKQLSGSATQSTDANGLATFADLSISQAGIYTLQANSTGLSSATSNSFTITAGTVSKIQPTDGTPQSAAIQTPFAKQLQATVLDSFDNPVSGATVTFTVPASGASATLSATSAVTDTSGHAAVTATANSIAGAYSVTAATAGASGNANFLLTNLTGSVGHVVFVQKPSDSAAGAVISPPVTVQVTDAGSNPVSGVSVTIHVQGGTPALGGTLTANTDVSGVATFANLSINVAGSYRLEAVSSGMSALSDPFQISAATSAVVILAFEGDGQSAAVGTAYAGPLKARAQDLYQNPIANASVTFAAPTTGATVTFSGSPTVSTGADGVAISPALTANSQAGAFQVTASTATASGPALFNLTNVPGSANKLAFVQQPVNTVAGATITPAVTVQVKDSAGNAVHTAGIMVTLTAVAGSTEFTTPPTQSTDANGLATFATLSISQAGSYTLQASSTGLISATSNSFTITAGTAAKIQATGGASQSATIQTLFAQQLQATVLDSFNNPVRGATVTFTLPASGASATLSATSAVTDTSGHAVVTATANNVAGSYSVTAATAGAGSSASFSLTNLTGSVGHVVFVQKPSNSAAGAVISPPVTVKVTDAGSNPIGGATVTIHVQGGIARARRDSECDHHPQRRGYVCRSQRHRRRALPVRSGEQWYFGGQRLVPGHSCCLGGRHPGLPRRWAKRRGGRRLRWTTQGPG